MLIKPVWAAVAGVGLLSIAGVAGIVIVASSGDEEEIVRPTQTAAVSASATPGENIATLPAGYEFSYPNQFILSDDPYLAKFFLTASPKAEELGEVAVYVYENPQQVPLEEFFNGQERPNLFEDAAGGYRPFSAGELQGIGLTMSSDSPTPLMLPISSDGYVYQFADPDQRHQTDGVFLQIVSSLKRAEG